MYPIGTARDDGGPGSFMKPSVRSRIVGCLLGGALGDALGGPGEAGFSRRVGLSGRLYLSDDTQLTLATCESIMEKRTVDPENVAAHLLRWFRAGRIEGLGSSTLKALRDLSVGTHWAVSGATGEYAAGNGAAMRIAPAAFLLDPAIPEDRTTIRDVSRITHHHDEAYAGAIAVVAAIRSTLDPGTSCHGSYLRVAHQVLPDCAVRDRIEALLEIPVSNVTAAASIGASGHVVDTIPLALFLAQGIATDPLDTVLRNAASIAGDTDTISSIAGQVAGAAVGAEAIPADRLTGVRGGDEALEITRRYADFAARLLIHGQP